jgi:protein-tyrosine phosphatase
MLDLHCHILPGVDDGAANLSEALAMARCAAADGITHIAATPHCQRHFRMFRDDILPHVERFNQSLRRENIPLIVFPGSEIQVVDSADYRREYAANLYCHLGDKRAFTLFECPWRRDQFPVDAAELIAWIVEQGTTPIIAHPERHPYLVEEPSKLQSMIDAGAWIQITVDSLLGNHGVAARFASQRLVRQFPNAVLSTDSHNMRRCSGLSPGFAWVRKHVGAEREAELRARAHQVLIAITRGTKQ